MNEALKTSEVPARLSELENRFGLLLDRKPVSGSRKLRYRLDKTVLVLKGGEEQAADA